MLEARKGVLIWRSRRPGVEGQSMKAESEGAGSKQTKPNQPVLAHTAVSSYDRWCNIEVWPSASLGSYHGVKWEGDGVIIDDYGDLGDNAD